MIQRRTSNSQGFVLITVLWIGLGLLLAVSAFLSTARQEALTVRAEVNGARAVELARSGLNVALADLGRINANQVKTSRDGAPVTLRMAEGTVTYRITDEGGKIDILHAPPQLLAPALVTVGETEGIDTFEAVNIAETLTNFVRAPDGTIRSVYNALTSAGLAAETALTASRYITTLSFSPQINPRTAPIAVLSSVPGVGPSDVEAIRERRESGGPMPVLGSAAVWLVEREGPVYTIEAEAVLATGGRALLRTQVAKQGLSFRGGLMRYEVLSYQIVR